MNISKKQAKKPAKVKKSPKGGKVFGWSATMDKAFKKLKKAKVFAKSAVAGTKGAFNQMLKLFGAGYSEGQSVWLSIPGDKKQRREYEQAYEKAGYTVKGGKVMVNKVSAKDTLRMDKSTGLINRYRTDARSGTRRKSTITLARDTTDLPELSEGERYIVFFRQGRGKSVQYYPRYYDDVQAMEDDMSTGYVRYTNWRAHVEILH